MKMLLEMRPALDGYSGIPQETRMLFHGLATLPGVEVDGLLQSGNLVLDAGLAQPPAATIDAAGMDRLSRVVVSLQQGPASHRLEWARKRMQRYAGPMWETLRGLLGGHTRLTWFDSTHFGDFVWSAMFAKTLPVDCMPQVAGRRFRIMRWPWSMVHAVGIFSGGIGHAMYPRLDTRGYDVMLAETPYPGRVRKGTRMVVRYHDAFPVLMPHTVKDRGLHRAMHFEALKRNAADGAWFACVSEATRADLLSIMPQARDRAVVIPNMVDRPFELETGPAARVPEILWSRRNRQAPHEGGVGIDPSGPAPRFLLMVSTIEPRKNHLAMLEAWELLRAQDDPELHLVCVGGLGWEHHAVMSRFEPWLARGGLHLLHQVPATDLRLLYRHATATVCPSLAEGFDFSGVEAMASGGVVAASDIAVHRDVYGAAAVYFSPYDVPEMAAALRRLIDPQAEELRTTLRAEGAQAAARHRPAQVLPRWREFLQRVAAEPAR